MLVRRSIEPCLTHTRHGLIIIIKIVFVLKGQHSYQVLNVYEYGSRHILLMPLHQARQMASSYAVMPVFQLRI